LIDGAQNGYKIICPNQLYILLLLLFSQGPSDPLNSQFRLSYNMVLNLLRKPEIDLKLVLEKSFLQWQNYTQLPELMAGED